MCSDEHDDAHSDDGVLCGGAELGHGGRGGYGGARVQGSEGRGIGAHRAAQERPVVV